MVARNRDHEGNPIGKANYNTILDSHQYEVDFHDDDASDMTSNEIAEKIYTQCDPEDRGHMVARNRDHEGNPIGRANYNTILDSHQYEVDFHDSDASDMTSNAIAEEIYAQCDPEGNQYLLLDSLIYFRSSESALSLADQNIVDVCDRQSICKTAKGCQICCQWKDGSTSWESLTNLKESHPVQTVQDIHHEPVFKYWVRHVLKKREQIISPVKGRNALYLKKTHKFGIEMPSSIQVLGSTCPEET